MPKYIDITGQRFGRLTAIHRIGRTKMWLFNCDCGGEKITTTTLVKRGLVKSCGCIWRTSTKPRIDVTGQRFGRLTALDYKDGKWRCQCDCGNVVYRIHQELLKSNIPSCGCYNIERINNKTHGMVKTSEYHIYMGIKGRCCNPNNSSYSRYGGRGIKVCDRWLGEHGFENFIADMGRRPSKEYSIDRIDNNGDYCPENCRWATTLEQANNKRNNTIIEHNGEAHTIDEWCSLLGVNLDKNAIGRRLRSGCSFEKIFSEGNLTTARRRYSDEQVRFMRSFNGSYSECKKALGIEITCAAYHQIINGKSYKNVI